MLLCWHADKKALNICKSGIAHFSSYTCTLVKASHLFRYNNYLRNNSAAKMFLTYLHFLYLKTSLVGWPWSVTLPRRERS